MTGFLKSWKNNSKSTDSTDSPTNPLNDTTKTKGNFDATKQTSMTFFICLVKPVNTLATNFTSSCGIFDGNLRPDHWHKEAVMVSPIADLTQGHDTLSQNLNSQNLNSQNQHNGAVSGDDLKQYSSKHSVDAKYLSVDQM